MNSLFKTWLTGLEIIVIWLCIVYGISAFSGEAPVRGLFYTAFGLLILIFSLIGLPKKWLETFYDMSLRTVFLTKGFLGFFFLVYSVMQYQFGKINTTPNLVSRMNAFSAYSTFVLIVISIIIDIREAS